MEKKTIKDLKKGRILYPQFNRRASGISGMGPRRIYT